LTIPLLFEKIHFFAHCSPSLFSYFSLSIQSGYVPEQFKITKALPIYKPGEPIYGYLLTKKVSFEAILRKILEKVVPICLADFLELNKL
jgi:hypothetical protein